VSTRDHEVSTIALCAAQQAVRDILRYVVGFRHFDVALETVLCHDCLRIRQYGVIVLFVQNLAVCFEMTIKINDLL